LHRAGHAQIERAAVILPDLQGVRAHPMSLVNAAVPHREHLAGQRVVLVGWAEWEGRRRLPVLPPRQQPRLAVPAAALVPEGERGRLDALGAG